MDTINIGGVNHPLLFNMNSLRSVMLAVGMENFAELQNNLDMAKSLDLSLTCAFYGILEGYEADGKETPFKNTIDIGRKVKKYTELLPALNGFTTAISEFFSTDPDEPVVKSKPSK